MLATINVCIQVGDHYRSIIDTEEEALVMEVLKSHSQGTVWWLENGRCSFQKPRIIRMGASGKCSRSRRTSEDRGSSFFGCAGGARPRRDLSRTPISRTPRKFQ